MVTGSNPVRLTIFPIAIHPFKKRARQLSKFLKPGTDLMMDPKNMPFDGKRMIWGGFADLVRL